MTTPLYLKLHYNKRQQLVDLRLGSVNDEWNWNRGLQTFYYGTDAVAAWNPFEDDDDNNGNVRRALHYVPTAVNGSGDVTTYVIPQLHDYSYDALNRISGMLEWQLDGSGNWQSNVVTQNFGYDRWGNRTVVIQLNKFSLFFQVKSRPRVECRLRATLCPDRFGKV